MVDPVTKIVVPVTVPVVVMNPIVVQNPATITPTHNKDQVAIAQSLRNLLATQPTTTTTTTATLATPSGGPLKTGSNFHIYYYCGKMTIL